MAFSAGDKVRLGNGSEGTVQRRVERAGFSGFIVKITKSENPEQVGGTVAASPAGMSKVARVPVVDRVVASLGGNDVVCEVAASPAEKSIGLQRHAGLNDSEGMYFPFSPTSNVQFHMGSVRFPIDIVFCESGRVARIVDNAQPGTRDRWGSRCDGVIEVRGGWCREHGVRVGSPVHVSDVRYVQAAATYDVLRTITTAQEEPESAPEEEKAPTPIEALKTLEDLQQARKMTPVRQLAAEAYATYLEENPEALYRDMLSAIEADRIVQSWEVKNRWYQELKKLADDGELPGYEDDSDVYQQQLAWWIADELQDVVRLAHEFFKQHAGDFEDLADNMGMPIERLFASAAREARLRQLKNNPVYRQAQQQLVVYFEPLGPMYLPYGSSAESKFYDLLDLYDGKAAASRIEAKWSDVSKDLDFMGRDAVVRALVDSGYPNAIGLLRVAQRHSEPDVREDTKQPGAVRGLPPEQAWEDRQIPADTPGVGDSADPANWDQEIGYDTSVSDLLDGRVPPIRPSASKKVAGGDVHPGDRVRVVDQVDGLKDDEKGVCFEVQGDMVWVKFDGEPVPRWLKNELVTQETEKEQVLQEIEEGDQGGEGGGLAGLLGAMG